MDRSDHEQRLLRLIEVGRGLVAQLDIEQLLRSLLEAARDLTGARYAAIGILNARRDALERFVTTGIDEPSRAAIGDPPQGRGVLGELIRHPVPLRLGDVAMHPRSYGFPPGHPPMHNFLGVPIVIRGEPWGNLYLTEKADGDFTAEDEDSLIVLADWAAIAIDNARLYSSADDRRAALERVVVSLEATTAIARAVGGETDIDRVLELIVKRGRALMDADSMLIALVEDDDLVISAVAGQVPPDSRGMRFKVEGTASGRVLQTRRPERVDAVPGLARISGGGAEFAGAEPHSALIVPLLFRGAPLGTLIAIDRAADRSWGPEHEELLESFAASAATAVHTAQSVAADLMRRSIVAAEEERRRWARELHDETLQGLAALRMLLSSALQRDSTEEVERAVREAVGYIETEAENLRSMIAELRPAALDTLGLGPALESLVERTRSIQDVDVALELDVPDRLAAELESTIYRLVQESLTNAAKHAQADHVWATVRALGDTIEVTVRDDGAGFDPTVPVRGFGLAGMRERVALTQGTLRISSAPGEGTTIRATFPTAAAEARAAS